MVTRKIAINGFGDLPSLMFSLGESLAIDKLPDTTAAPATARARGVRDRNLGGGQRVALLVLRF